MFCTKINPEIIDYLRVRFNPCTHSSMDQNMGFRFPRLGFDSLWVYTREATIQWEPLRVLLANRW